MRKIYILRTIKGKMIPLSAVIKYFFQIPLTFFQNLVGAWTFTMQSKSIPGKGMDHDTFTKQPNSFSGIGMDHDTFTMQPNSFLGIGLDRDTFTKQPNFIPGIEVEMEHDTISDLIYLAEQANETGIEILYNSNMTGIFKIFIFLTFFLK